MAELLGEGDSGRTAQEGPGSSVKFEGGEEASVAVEWSGVSLSIACDLSCPLRQVVVIGLEPVHVGYENMSSPLHFS